MTETELIYRAYLFLFMNIWTAVYINSIARITPAFDFLYGIFLLFAILTFICWFHLALGGREITFLPELHFCVVKFSFGFAFSASYIFNVKRSTHDNPFLVYCFFADGAAFAVLFFVSLSIGCFSVCKKVGENEREEIPLQFCSGQIELRALHPQAEKKEQKTLCNI